MLRWPEENKMKVRIIVDSTADMAPRYRGRAAVAPLTIHFGGEELIDGVSIDRRRFYERLVESDELPTTSQASPAVFQQLYEDAKRAGESAVVITISSKLSGTYQSACLAAADYENVYVVDSLSAAIGTGILAEYAIGCAEAGMDAVSLAAHLEQKRADICVIGLLDTLEYLKRGGRISKTVAFAGGLLSIKDHVFGPDGILNDSAYVAAIKDTLYNRITVEDLLRHKGGFSKRGGDPMFSTRWIMMQNGWKEVPTQEKLMELQLKRRVKFVPGTAQEYSNFGYLALSMVIEKVSGMDYETFMQENVLRPIGCVDFHIAGNYYKHKLPNETRYYVQHDDEPAEEFNNSGRKVIRCYGGNNVAGLSGAGAWAASTPELALLVASIDGRPEVPDIISKESVDQMTEYFDESTYSLGWNDTKDGYWTRTGTFAGTSALIKYFPDGECWIFISNTSTYKGPGLARNTAELFDKLRMKYSSKFPPRNMFYPPHQNTSSDEEWFDY